MGHNKNCSQLRNRFKCVVCSKGYMGEHYKENHEKLHKERIKNHGKIK